MDRYRKESSDSDRSSGVRDKESVKEKAGAKLSQKSAGTGSIPKKLGNGSSNASSIRSYRMDDDEKDFTNVYSSLAGDPHSGNGIPRIGYDASDSDPYAAVADTPRRRSGLENSYPYASLRIAGTPRIRGKSSPGGIDGPNKDPYLPLKIAASHPSDSDDGDDVANDSNDSSRTEEDNSDGSMREKQAYGEDSGSEDADKDSNYARVSVVSIGSEQGKDTGVFPRSGRVSVAGSLAEYATNAGRESSGYARVSVAGSEADYSKDRDEEFPGYARVSVAGSASDHRGDVYAKISRAGSAKISRAGSFKISRGGSGADLGKDIFSRVSNAGSEIDRGQDVYARLSVAGSEAENGEDIYARLSVAGSGAEHEEDTYARLSVAGSGAEHEEDTYAKLSVAGSGAEHDEVSYARVSVAGSEAEYRGVDVDFTGYAKVPVAGSEVEYGKNFDSDVSGYARLTVVQNKDDHVPVDRARFALDDTKDRISHLSEKEQRFVASVRVEGEDQESRNKEHEMYMELSPEVQANLQYRVRVILISPLFELNDRKLSAFSDIYKRKFGESLESMGFSSVVSLCRAMPHVVQKTPLEENGELLLVGSNENLRAVSGIRSGLRRIVYDALKSLPSEITCPQLEEKCSELLGNPLMKVLSEHGYDPPNVESLINDMPDIAGFEDAELESRVYLCSGAEDPALTDGLLVKSTIVDRAKITESKGVSKVDNRWMTAQDPGNLNSQRESLKIGSSVTLRSLKNELRRSGSDKLTSSADDEILQARLHMRILLAFDNSGHGVEVVKVPELYAKTFGRKLDLQEFGVKSLMELASHWQDIFLLQEPKPGWVVLVPSAANRRILNTVRTGLRSSVFSVLVETYPEGLEPLEFLHCLQQGMSGELWEVLDAAGYICSDVENADGILSSSSSSDFQLVDFEEICVLLDDMMDFVRLGSNEDGSVVVRLRKGEVPVLDLVNCKMEETDVGSFDELFVNLMMIAVDVTENSGADDGSPDENGFISVGHVQSLVKSFEGSGGLRSAHSQTPDSLKLKHELRLILGCPEYLESGLPWSDLINVYRDRTGEELGSKSKVKSLLRAMPDIVYKDSLLGDHVHLFKTTKNLRILSTTKAGLRQVLFWALVKNPGGVWANLLEGWFTDFTGMSLSAALQMHGYETSKSRPFYPVHIFLRDMSDLLQKKSAPLEIYTWAREVEDPVHNDANLLGLSELMIQYDSLRLELEMSTRKMEQGEETVDKSALKDVKGEREAELVNYCIPEKFPSKQDEGNLEADLEVEPASETSMKEDESNREATLYHMGKTSVEEKSSWAEIYHVHVPSEAGDVLGNGKFEGSEGDHANQLLSHKVEKDANGGKFFNALLKENTSNEQYQPDTEEDGSHSEENEDENFLSRRYATKIEGNRSESTSEAYAQLRVASKGPKVNLDEWQFTDSEGEEDNDVNDDFEEDYENEEDEEDEEDDEYEEEDEDKEQDSKEDQQEKQEQHSKTKNPREELVQSFPAAPYVGPKVKVTGKDTSRAWVLPNKGIPWK